MTKNNKSWKILSLIGLVQVVALFTVLLSILTLFSEHHRYLELFSHFKLQYFIASVTCAVIFVFYKNFKIAVVLTCVSVLNLTFIIPWYLSDLNNLSDDNLADITILHSNVHTRNDHFQNFVDLINQENPEVFIMQEVNNKWLSEISELEKTYEYKHTIPRNDNFGIAIYSKYPFESVKEITLGNSSIPSIMATFILTGNTITILATHPLPPANSEYYFSRNAQIQKMAELSRNHHDPLILIGDLNTTMWSHDYLPLEIDTDLRNARKGFGLLPTWPTQFQLPIFMISIDHCLVSSHFVVNNIKVGDDIGSDHLPLIVNLSLKKYSNENIH